MTCVFAGCSGKKTDTPEPAPTPIPVQPPEPLPKAVEEDLPGVDLTGLTPVQRQLFFNLIDKVQSADGKAQTLRAALKGAPPGRRSLVAATRLVAAIKQGATDLDDLKGAYEARYGKPSFTFDVSGAPCIGPPQAPVTMVEFFDYGCPHCKQAREFGHDLLNDYPGKVRICYFMYPLLGEGGWAARKTNFPLSIEAAQAALAAHAQGKWSDMSELLWAQQHKLEPGSFVEMARKLGLDLAKFDADFKAALPTIEKLEKVGDDAGVSGTPAFYVNGRATPGLDYPSVKDAVAEEIAVTR